MPLLRRRERANKVAILLSLPMKCVILHHAPRKPPEILKTSSQDFSVTAKPRSSVDTVCSHAHQRSSEVEELSAAMTRVVSEMQQVLSHAMGIQEQIKRTTEVSHEI